MSNILVLGIETSCDETSGAIFDSTKGLLSNVVHSQIDTHAPYGGVVPELASRDHLSKIALVVQKTLTDAKKDLDSIDCIAWANRVGMDVWPIGNRLIGEVRLDPHVNCELRGGI